MGVVHPSIGNPRDHLRSFRICVYNVYIYIYEYAVEPTVGGTDRLGRVRAYRRNERGACGEARGAIKTGVIEM